MWFIPNTKTMLVKEIHKLSPYTLKEINLKYDKEFNKNPTQAKFYKKKRAIRIMQGWLNNLIYNKKKYVWKIYKFWE